MQHYHVTKQTCAAAGGQKHRIALARACYADADVYLFDDPLSAVDAHVGRQLVSDCITGLLRGKTRILVTHQLQFLSEADLIVMMEDGKIAQTGTYAELLAHGITFAEVKTHESTEQHHDPEQQRSTSADGSMPAPLDGQHRRSTDTVRASGELLHRRSSDLDNTGPSTNGANKRSKSGAASAAAKPAGAPKFTAGALTQKEDRSTGSVDHKVYMTYLRAWGKGLRMPLLFLGITLSEKSFNVRAYVFFPSYDQWCILQVLNNCELDAQDVDAHF